MKKLKTPDRPNKRAINSGMLFYMLLMLLLTVIGWRFIDPDYGWRLRAGEYILRNGIPETDIFTYTMPSFPWVDHAWPQDVVIYLTRAALGKFGQSFLWALVAFACLLVSSKIFKGIERYDLKIFGNNKQKFLSTKDYPANIFLILGFLSFTNYFGVRVQVVSWLFFAVFVNLLLHRKTWLKYRKFLPVFFWIWAILHGGFASGLAVYLLFLIFRTIRRRKLDAFDLGIFLVSTLITLINPYGPSLWREVWSSVSDSQLRWRIQEWQPFIFGPEWSTAILMGMSAIFVYLFRKSFKLEELALFTALILQAMLSTRHVPLWVIVAVPLGTKAVYLLYKESIEHQHGKQRFVFFYKILWVITILLFVTKIIYTGFVLYKADEGSFYPKSAVKFLKRQDYEGRMFSIYGWGGYLIWKYPEKKVYIDGRMPSWRWDADVAGETNSAVDDYFALLEGDVDLEKELDRYEVRTVLWRPKGKQSFWNLVGNKLKQILSLEQEEGFVLTQELEDLGWERVYLDETAVIYRKS